MKRLFQSSKPRPKPVQRPPRLWETVRSEYVAGDGSLAKLAQRHDLRLSTIEGRSRREGWVRLRRQREEAALQELVGSPVLPATIEPVEDRSWWNDRDKRHLIDNLAVLTRLRTALDAQISGASAGELERIGHAMAAVIEGERVLLELTPTPASRKGVPSLRPSRNTDAYPMDIEPEEIGSFLPDTIKV